MPDAIDILLSHFSIIFLPLSTYSITGFCLLPPSHLLLTEVIPDCFMPWLIVASARPASIASFIHEYHY